MGRRPSTKRPLTYQWAKLDIAREFALDRAVSARCPRHSMPCQGLVGLAQRLGAGWESMATPARECFLREGYPRRWPGKKWGLVVLVHAHSSVSQIDISENRKIFWKRIEQQELRWSARFPDINSEVNIPAPLTKCQPGCQCTFSTAAKRAGSTGPKDRTGYSQL
jgi:hypothetical protein